MQRLSEEALQVAYEGDCFPNVEAHLVEEADGSRVVVMEFSHLGPEQGLPFAGNCRSTFTGDAP